MHSKQLDFFVVFLLLFFGGFFGYYFNVGNVTLGLLYLGLPSFYLLWRKREDYGKLLWGLAIFGVLFGTVFDFIGTLNSAWEVRRVNFPSLLIGSWPVENVIGYLWMTLFILVFYEHFLDHHLHHRLSKRHSRLLFVSLCVLVATFLVHLLQPQLLTFPHFYLVAGLVAIAFPILFAWYNPAIIQKFASLAFFFFFVWLGLEIIGVRNQNWLFPASGDFLGSVSLLGARFPFEEVFFWFMWYPAVIVAYYEYFIDDGR